MRGCVASLVARQAPAPPGPFGVGLRQFDGSAGDERKSGIKSWRHCRSFRQAHLPAHSPAGERFGGQPPAVRAALRPEMCGQFQGVPGLPEMGSKTERKRNSAVVIPQRLRSQEKSRGHARDLPLFSAAIEACPYGGRKLRRYIKEKGRRPKSLPGRSRATERPGYVLSRVGQWNSKRRAGGSAIGGPGRGATDHLCQQAGHEGRR